MEMEPTDSVSSLSDCKNLTPSPQNEHRSVSDCGGEAWGRGGGGSIAERRAAKFGFNAERITTARFRTNNPLESPGARSPCLTIPPGISPTALLDSPVMLHNSQMLPSPTTGTFPISSLNHETLADGERGNDSIFRFKPPARPDSLACFSSSDNQETNVDYQTLVSAHQMGIEFPSGLEAITKNCSGYSSGEVKALETMVPAQSADLRVRGSDVASDHITLLKPIHREGLGNHRPSEGDQRGTHASIETSRTSDDGYNWRKYGQKQVKGSEYPRSYYKCTHPSCQVKKKVERSHDGQITEIIYKSNHNHPKPQPSRRATLGSSFSFNDMSEGGEGSGLCVRAEGGAVWRNIHMGSRDTKLSSDWRADGLERTSSASVLTDVSDPLTISRVRGVYDSAGTPEFSSTHASHDDDDDDDDATQGSISLVNDADEEESDSKRRKTENCYMETNLTSRAVREPRVVVQIESEVDILDDGYRWRKYGQKVVKGNPNPRSYYKCTSAGCLVRKHVERASQNLKCVITTYEGKHNHEVPAARNSSNVNSGGGHLSGPGGQSAVSLSRNNLPKPEAQVQDFAPRFDRKAEFSNEYLRSSVLASYGNEMKYGPPSMYQMKLPPLQQTMPYSSFGLNPNQQVGSITSMVPDFPMALPLSMHNSANPSLSAFDYNTGVKVCPESDMRYLRPKQEQKDYDVCLPMVDQANPHPSSSSTSLYGRMMGRFPS